MDAVNVSTMRHYFDLLETALKENNLLHSPGQIYNVDKTGVPLDPKAPNVIVKTGLKKVQYRATGKKGQVTVVASSTSTLSLAFFSDRVNECNDCTLYKFYCYHTPMTRSNLTANQESILSTTTLTTPTVAISNS